MLARLFRVGTERSAAGKVLVQMPRERWRVEEAAPLLESILEWAQAVPAAQRTSREFVELVQLGGDLAGLLPREEAASRRKTLRELGVRAFVVRAVREKMAYDVTRLQTAPGKSFEIVFENADIMPHNFVIIRPGTRNEVGLAANQMTATPDKRGRLYVPDLPAIVAATKMLEPGQTERLSVLAPREPGEYEFVCTFPGHWTVMFGKLVVSADPAPEFCGVPEPAPLESKHQTNEHSAHPRR